LGPIPETSRNHTVPDFVNKHANKHGTDKKRRQDCTAKSPLLQDRSEYKEQEQEKSNVYPEVDSKNPADADRPFHKIIASFFVVITTKDESFALSEEFICGQYYSSRPRNWSHCSVSLSVRPWRLPFGSLVVFFLLNSFCNRFQKSSDFTADAPLVRAALRNLRSLLTIISLLGAVLACILSSITVSASLPGPAKKTSAFVIFSNTLLSRGPTPSKMISPLSPISFKYPPIILHN
jgi:hypothetical protein